MQSKNIKKFKARRQNISKSEDEIIVVKNVIIKYKEIRLFKFRR